MVYVVERYLPGLDQEVREAVELGLRWQAELVEQVHDLLERGPAGQVGDVVADVPQAALLPVDVGQARLRGHDLAKTLVRHVRAPVSVGRAPHHPI